MRKPEEIIIKGGSRLSDLLAEKSYLDLSGADLHEAYLYRLDLRHANLKNADLSIANLFGAILFHADLRRAKLVFADLRQANLRNADLSGTNLSGSDLHKADLRDADLRSANLSEADLSFADLTGANLSEADLSFADLTGANLSGAKGLLDPARWMAENFETDELGYIVYKVLGSETPRTKPGHWQIAPGAFLEEMVNPLPTVDCGCGINFAALGWVMSTYPNSPIWRCRIRWADLPSVVVPYNTDGKARCGRLELIEIVNDG